MEPTRNEWKDWAAAVEVKEAKPDSSLYVCYQNRQSQGGLAGLLGGLGGIGTALGGYAANALRDG